VSPAIAWTVAGALIAATALEALPRSGPPPMSLDEVLQQAAVWLDAALRNLVHFLRRGP
jgi:hypothetical protein